MGPEVRVFVALGANLGDAKATVIKACADLGRLPQTRLIRQSSLYQTAPIDSSGPDFINAVAELATGLDAHTLLIHLQTLERAALRERTYPNAPRTLDIDILSYGDQIINTPTLTLPHPRMSQRAFVLVPLAEIAPERVAATQLLAVSNQVIRRVT